MPDAGWYDDPEGTPQMLRYWDGTKWTDHRRRSDMSLLPPPFGPMRAAPDQTTPTQAAPSGATPLFGQNSPDYGQAWRDAQQPGRPIGRTNPSPATYEQRSAVPYREPFRPYSAPPSNGFSTAGIAMGVIALLIFPPLFGILGIIFSAIALGRREPRAGAAMAMSIIGLIAGMVIGAVLFTQMNQY